MMKKIFLQPGEISFQTNHSLISTIVGSCISVCIWDKIKRSGGMCHYYLPRRENGTGPDQNYGEFAILNLLKEFKKSGSNPKDLVAKVLGGGHVIDVELGANRDVGDENTKIALSLLAKYKIPIVAKAIGGGSGKKINFDTDTGDVKFQNIKKTAQCSEKKAEKIKVLIVDDSKPIRLILRKMIERDPDFEIIGDAEDGLQAIKSIEKNRPDVITLDLQMPNMDGNTFLKNFIAKNYIPTIVVSAMNIGDTSSVLDAVDNGAFHYIKKPSFEDIEGLTFDLHQILKAAHGSKGKRQSFTPLVKTNMIKPALTSMGNMLVKCGSSMILIGSSTGGTEALKSVLTRLPADIPPIIVVQHMPPVFTAQFAARLNELCQFKVVEAADRMKIESKCCYLAPGAKQMAVVQYPDGDYYIKITDDPPVNRFKPSVDYLFNSAAKIRDRKLLAIILTGMGNDGSRGMLELKNHKAHTIAQDESSSVVYGMPKAAVELKAALEVKSLDNIPQAILHWLLK